MTLSVGDMFGVLEVTSLTPTSDARLKIKYGVQ